jgi:hypothetical protein
MAAYHRMTVAEKERYHRDQLREPPMRCPACEAALQPEDLLAHQAERCPGRPAPHPHSKWVSWTDALKTGVPRETLRRWIDQGQVRTQGDRPRRYLYRDIVALQARRAPKPRSAGAR